MWVSNNAPRSIEINVTCYLIDLQKGFYELEPENVLDGIVSGQVPPRLVNIQRQAFRDTERRPPCSRHFCSRPGHVAVLDRERTVVSDAGYTTCQDTRNSQIRVGRSVNEFNLKVPRGRRRRLREPNRRLAGVDPPTDLRASRPYSIQHSGIGNREG